MNISVLPGADKPAYRQIYDQLSAQILSGKLTAGTALPPIRTVSQQIGVSVITVRAAWDMLENDGFIESRVGSGCYVAYLPEDDARRMRYERVSSAAAALALAAMEAGFSVQEAADILKAVWNE